MATRNQYQRPESFSLTETEFSTKWSFIWNQLPMTVNLTSIFDPNLKRLLASHENVTDVHFANAELCLRTFALTTQV